MSKGKVNRTIQKLEELVSGEPIEVVFRNGERQRCYFQGVDETNGVYSLECSDMVLGKDFDHFSGFQIPTYELPLHNIGYLLSQNTNKKISAMPFQKPKISQKPLNS